MGEKLNVSELGEGGEKGYQMRQELHPTGLGDPKKDVGLHH